MIIHILIISSAIIIYEFVNLIDLKKIINSNFNTYKKIHNLFTFKKVSDYRKQKLILHYSKDLIIQSIKIIIILSFIMIFIFVLNFFFSSYMNILFSIFGIIELSIIFMSYKTI